MKVIKIKRIKSKVNKAISYLETLSKLLVSTDISNKGDLKKAIQNIEDKAEFIRNELREINEGD